MKTENTIAAIEKELRAIATENEQRIFIGRKITDLKQKAIISGDPLEGAEKIEYKWLMAEGEYLKFVQRVRADQKRLTVTRNKKPCKCDSAN
jgi:hypothetical protein